MSFELDVRPVGNGTTSGDAIAIRYGAFNGDPAAQRVVVIDGGFQENGEDLVDLITKIYGTNRVDLMILTHPHDDHVNGLHELLDQLHVIELWMHRPWEHAESVRAFVRDKRITTQKFSERLQKSLESAYELEQLAVSRRVAITEPFQGVSFDNRFFVIGPSLEYFEELVCDFGEPVSAAAKIAQLFEAAPQKISQLRRKISETILGQEQLVEPAIGDVNARNNSSTIIVAKLESKVFLLTADAGVPALTAAADYADAQNYSLRLNITHAQMPHHGSKRNVGPTILNRIIGSIGQDSKKPCFISASKEWDTKHPSTRVTNALNRRGARVYTTQGQTLYFRSDDIPMRPDFGPATPVGFVTEYEEED
jgi:beta-lactamase superfamily II metal-dependent hydrolase